jgi:hypothetical protein
MNCTTECWEAEGTFLENVYRNFSGRRVTCVVVLV